MSVKKLVVAALGFCGAGSLTLAVLFQDWTSAAIGLSNVGVAAYLAISEATSADFKRALWAITGIVIAWVGLIALVLSVCLMSPGARGSALVAVLSFALVARAAIVLTREEKP